MALLAAFLALAAVAGQSSRSFDWRTYVLVACAAAVVTGVYYFSGGVW